MPCLCGLLLFGREGGGGVGAGAKAREEVSQREQQQVQCKLCRDWQHAECAGYDPSRDGALDFLCVRCCLKEVSE